MISKGKILTFLFAIVLVISAFLRFSQVSNFNSPFTFDQARDMLDIRVLAGFHDFKVSGPTTSVTGLNLGPFYYYFSLPAFWIGGGNPQVLVYWNIIWFLFSAVVVYLFFYKRNNVLGFFVSIILLMAPQLFSLTRYFWNANSVVYFIIFYFLAFWNFLENKNKRNALIFGITAGMVIQFEAAFGSMCVAFSILIILLSRKKYNFRNYLFGLLPWFLPQLVFEIKNKFQMSKLFLGIFSGKNPVLGEKIPFSDVLALHLKTITSFFEGQFMLPLGVGLAIIITAFIIIFLNKKYRNLGFYFLGFIVFSFIYYSTIYHHELKTWYLEGIRVWYCFVVGLAIVSVSKYQKIFYILIALFISTSFYLTVIDQNNYSKISRQSNDPKNTANLISNLDWVYQKTNGNGFDAYNYVPEIYDYSTQYLYWWYGQNKYGYLPQKISYSLDPVPQYIRMQPIFYEKAKPSNGEKIALIYETKSSYLDWLGQFKNYCLIDKKITSWQTTIEYRQKCPDLKQK